MPLYFLFLLKLLTMSFEERKKNLAAELLKESDHNVLIAVERLLHKNAKKKNAAKKKEGLMRFAGIWSKQESEDMKKVIEEMFEKVHADEWK